LVDKKYKIYLRKSTSTRLPIDVVRADGDYAAERKAIGGTRLRSMSEQSPYTFNLTKEVDALLLARYAPAGVVINSDMEIIQFRGHTDTYLSHVPGKASLDLLKMSREGLVVDLRRAIQEAQKTGMLVRKENVRFKYHQQYRTINLEVIPVKTPSDELLILFESAAPAIGSKSEEVKLNEVKGDREKEGACDPQVAQLSRELESTKEYLQSIIEDKEASNEELRVANEEIQSSNEELQSINEELETAKEELQSTNEELVTVNEELQNRNIELSGVNDDLSNLINSVNIPIIILGNDLRIRRFTPAVQKLMHVLPSDIGRSINDIKLDINIPDFEQLIAGVIDTIQTKEQEIQTVDGKWYYMRIRPYKATGNRIEGSVITLIDISELKQSQEQLRMSRDFAEAIVETMREPLVVLDARLRIISVNEAYSKIFQVNKKEVENALIYEVGNRQWDIPELRKLLGTITGADGAAPPTLSANSKFQDLEIEQTFPVIGHRKMLLNARRICQKDGGTQMILLTIEDVTGKGE
jgi:two-component system CheB/CheR fusion protein